ncbi:uncharacterized protein LOC126608139 [Malus sylvestris]|uniref:uncharacterized protein LOC126608139 n=1 Tax=Malus sylvestris TaxID=3752 RepID=UPI0021ABF814|nr:uncharacterized protein LOC126608139 [Malus sylvestris]
MSGLAKIVVVLLLTRLFMFVLLALLVMLVLIILIDLFLIAGLTTSTTLARSLEQAKKSFQCMIIHFTTILPIVEVVPIPNVSVSCSNTRRCCRSRDFGGDQYHTHMVLYILQ